MLSNGTGVAPDGRRPSRGPMAFPQAQQNVVTPLGPGSRPGRRPTIWPAPSAKCHFAEVSRGRGDRGQPLRHFARISGGRGAALASASVSTATAKRHVTEGKQTACETIAIRPHRVPRDGCLIHLRHHRDRADDGAGGVGLEKGRAAITRIGGGARDMIAGGLTRPVAGREEMADHIGIGNGTSVVLTASDFDIHGPAVKRKPDRSVAVLSLPEADAALTAMSLPSQASFRGMRLAATMREVC